MAQDSYSAGQKRPGDAAQCAAALHAQPAAGGLQKPAPSISGRLPISNARLARRSHDDDRVARIGTSSYARSRSRFTPSADAARGTLEETVTERPRWPSKCRDCSDRPDMEARSTSPARSRRRPARTGPSSRRNRPALRNCQRPRAIRVAGRRAGALRHPDAARGIGVAARGGQPRAEARGPRARRTSIAGPVDRPGVAAKRELEEAQRDQAEAEAALAQAESGRPAAGALAGRAVVTARFAGVIAKRWHNPGDMVEAAAFDPILRVIDPARLQAVASVPARPTCRASSVGRPGHVVGPGGTAEQMTRADAASATRSDATVGEVRLAFTGRRGSPRARRCRFRSSPSRIRKRSLIEAAAVQHEGDEAFVMIVEKDKKAHRQVVSSDSRTANRWKCSAASPRRRVIVKGQNGLPDGADVTIVS